MKKCQEDNMRYYISVNGNKVTSNSSQVLAECRINTSAKGEYHQMGTYKLDIIPEELQDRLADTISNARCLQLKTDNMQVLFVRSRR